MSINPMIETIENEDGSITTREPATADLYLFGTIRIPEKVAHIIAFIGAIFIAFLVVNSCVEPHKKFTQPDPFVSGPGALSSSEKYIAFDGPAQRTYQPSEGEIAYCDPDDHGRPTCAYGLLTPKNREKGKNYQRHDVDFNPSGWPETNTYIDHFGPLWVKTPMFGTQLGGDFVPNNTITREPNTWIILDLRVTLMTRTDSNTPSLLPHSILMTSTTRNARCTTQSQLTTRQMSSFHEA